MNIPKIAGLMKLGKNLVLAHRPELLFGASITATLASVGLAAKGGYEAGQRVLEAEHPSYDLSKPEEALSTKEKAALTWQCYVPAALATTTALGSTTGLHIVHVQEKKALAAAALAAVEEVRSEAAQFAKDVDQSIDEKLTDKKGQDLKESINEKTTARMVEAGELYLVKDIHTGRSWYGSENKVQNAINEVNRMLQSRDVSLNDFYVWAGVPELRDGEEVGWNSGDFIVLKWDDDHLEDGRPVRAFSFQGAPRQGYDATHR